LLNSYLRQSQFCNPQRLQPPPPPSTKNGTIPKFFRRDLIISNELRAGEEQT
jgi:hypothetical protein